jgi:hypothetical protein
MAWIPPPEPVTWDLAKPVKFAGASYNAITVRAPTSADLVKATAVAGESGLVVTLRLIATISEEGIPFEALLKVSSWQIDQISSYFDSFNGAPLPGPLAARAAAEAAAVQAEAAAAAAAATPAVAA